MRQLSILGVLAALSFPLTAQTTNVVSFNQLLLNGAGAGQTSCINLTAIVGAGIQIAMSALPGSPVILALDANCAPGTIVVGPNNSVDTPLGPSYRIVLDGTGILAPSGLSPFLFTNSAGLFGFFVPNAPLQPNLNFGVQAALVNPGYAAGFQVTAAFNVNGVTDPNLGPGSAACNANAAAISAGDDTATPITWGFAMPFYGGSFTNGFANSNGSLSFGAGFTTFTETITVFVTGPARAAAWWDDLFVGGNATPPHGTLSFFTDGTNIAELCWADVPEFVNNPTTSANHFKITLVGGSAPQVIFDYGAMTALDGIVGLTPGLQTPATVNVTLNLSASSGATLTNPIAAYSEQFIPPASPNDLANRRITWLLDGTGRPIGIN